MQERLLKGGGSWAAPSRGGTEAGGPRPISRLGPGPELLYSL